MGKKKNKIETIQLLRAIGCMMVVLCHTAYTDFGQTGVDFFLIISGFVMMYSTEKRGMNSFWKKRLVRIIPLYWGITLFTSVLVIILPQLFNSYEVSWEYLIKSMLFLPYYHNDIAGPILALGWTLNYEMIFYLIFWICAKVSYKHRGLFSSVVIVLLIVICSIIKLPLPIGYWGKPVMIEFVYGIILYYLFLKFDDSKIKINNKKIITVITYLLVGVAFYIMEIFIHNEYVSRGFSVALVASIVVLWCVLFDNYIYVPVWLGKIGNESYELYLLHIFAVRVFEIILTRIIGVNIITSIITVSGTVLVIHLFLTMTRKVASMWRNYEKE